MKQYQLNARKLERKFIRLLQKRKSFLTVTGRENQLVSVNMNSLVLQTAMHLKPWSVSRRKLRQSIYYTFHRRTVFRKDLERFSNYSSSLLGILFKVFDGMVFIKRLPSGLLRLSLKGVRVYFSGLERDPSIRKMVKEEGGKHLLLNYYYIRNNRNWIDILGEGYSVLIDSGAFTVWKQKMKQQDSNEPALFDVNEVPLITIEEYASFIQRYQDEPRIIGFFNLDVVGDPLATKINFLKLRDLVPTANILPVWQFEDTIESLEELARENHEVIGFGGSVPYLSNRTHVVRKKLGEVFRRLQYINLHFLGGANRLLLEYEFFSSDTTAYLNARKSDKQRKIYLKHGERVAAPEDMSVIDIIRQNIRFLASLEKRYEQIQGGFRL